MKFCSCRLFKLHCMCGWILLKWLGYSIVLCIQALNTVLEWRERERQRDRETERQREFLRYLGTHRFLCLCIGLRWLESYFRVFNIFMQWQYLKFGGFRWLKVRKRKEKGSETAESKWQTQSDHFKEKVQ